MINRKNINFNLQIVQLMVPSTNRSRKQVFRSIYMQCVQFSNGTGQPIRWHICTLHFHYTHNATLLQPLAAHSSMCGRRTNRRPDSVSLTLPLSPTFTFALAAALAQPPFSFTK